VLADPDQLKQVFVNIIMNAADAMTGLEQDGRSDTSHTLSILTEEKQGRLEITFHDTGPGIPEPELARIFDPFYSTKEPGRGTGLGLSVCYRIVEALGGTLRAESKGGAGATIIVDIPLHAMNNGQDL
jgi:histidine kinase